MGNSTRKPYTKYIRRNESIICTKINMKYEFLKQIRFIWNTLVYKISDRYKKKEKEHREYTVKRSTFKNKEGAKETGKWLKQGDALGIDDKKIEHI